MTCVSCYLLRLENDSVYSNNHDACPSINFASILAFNKINAGNKFLRITDKINITFFLKKHKRQRIDFLKTKLNNIKNINYKKLKVAPKPIKLNNISLNQLELFHPILYGCRIYEMACFYLKYNVLIEGNIEGLKNWLNIMLGENIIEHDYICTDIAFEIRVIEVENIIDNSRIGLYFLNDPILTVDVNYKYLEPKRVNSMLARNAEKYDFQILRKWLGQGDDLKEFIISMSLVFYKDRILYLI